MVFDWNDLNYFLALARHGRLMSAAKRLRVDHTTVSRRIGELEKALDQKLFTRTANGFVLSDAGRQLLERAETIEANMRLIDDTIGNNTSDISGSVRFATMEGIASLFLAQKVSELSHRHPALRLELLTKRYVTNLPRREADVLLSFIRPAGPKLITRKIGDFFLKLYASPSYLKRNGTPRSIDDLKNHLFIDYIEDIIIIQETHWLLDVVDAPNVIFRSSSMLAQQNAAAAGLGIVLLPLFSVTQDKRLKAVLPENSTKRNLWLSVHEDMQYVPRIKAVTGFLKQIIEREQRFLRTGVR